MLDFKNYKKLCSEFTHYGGDKLIERDKEEKKRWCKKKIAHAKLKIESYQDKLEMYESLLESLKD